MTKDVLVSISGKHIDIMNDPAEGYETGDDAIEVVTPADYYCRNGKHYIIYDEVFEGMAGTVKNKIKITGTDMVEIMKSGLTSSHMIFEKNKKNLTYYKTPYGQMLVGVNTKKWRSAWKTIRSAFWSTMSWTSTTNPSLTARSK